MSESNDKSQGSKLADINRLAVEMAMVNSVFVGVDNLSLLNPEDFAPSDMTCSICGERMIESIENLVLETDSTIDFMRRCSQMRRNHLIEKHEMSIPAFVCVAYLGDDEEIDYITLALQTDLLHLGGELLDWKVLRMENYEDIKEAARDILSWADKWHASEIHHVFAVVVPEFDDNGEPLVVIEK